MKRSMFSAEQVVYALRQEEAGTAVEAVCRSPGVFVPWLRSVSYFQALNGANRSEPVHAGVGSGRSEKANRKSRLRPPAARIGAPQPRSKPISGVRPGTICMHAGACSTRSWTI